MTETVGWFADDQFSPPTNEHCQAWMGSLASQADRALRSGRPFVILDDQAANRTVWFEGLKQTLVAWDLGEVEGVIGAAQQAAETGFEVAGFLSYRAGQAFDVLGICPQNLHSELQFPLVWFGVFEKALPCHFPARDWQDCAFSLETLISDGEFQARVRSVIEQINAGSTYQVNLTFPSLVEVSNLFSYYDHIRQRSKAPFGAIISTGRHQVLSFSPELFFHLSGHSIVTRPMKGTRPRGGCSTADASAANELKTSEKERAENLMIVDLLRNDLSRICQPGSVHVPKLFSIEEYPTIWQMTSTVIGELQHEFTVLDVLKALFPCGSIVGAPKIIASQIIAKIEQFDRGLYTGSIGWIRRNRAVFNVAIRTLQLAKVGSGYAGRLDVGAGIVADSHPRSEWEECMTKATFAWPARRVGGATRQS